MHYNHSNYTISCSPFSTCDLARHQIRDATSTTVKVACSVTTSSTRPVGFRYVSGCGQGTTRESSYLKRLNCWRVRCTQSCAAPSHDSTLSKTSKAKGQQHTGNKTSASPGKALRYEMSAPARDSATHEPPSSTKHITSQRSPRSMNDFVLTRNRTLLRLVLYLTATDRSVVVDMGASSVPPSRAKAGGTVRLARPR